MYVGTNKEVHVFNGFYIINVACGLWVYHILKIIGLKSKH